MEDFLDIPRPKMLRLELNELPINLQSFSLDDSNPDVTRFIGVTDEHYIREIAKLLNDYVNSWDADFAHEEAEKRRRLLNLFNLTDEEKADWIKNEAQLMTTFGLEYGRH